ncbi:hypothetical protein D3C80_807670 [compost metagenome]
MNNYKSVSYKAGAMFAVLFGLATSVHAAVTPEQAARLQKDLTPLGGERAANKDGSIPAWDGGYTKIPAGYKSGQPRPDPFANEKPLFTITSKNMAEHADKLSAGQKELLTKYPNTYRMDIYPTHRTASAPDWLYKFTVENATRAKSSANGQSIEGAYGGIPFPIPQSGAEVMWNHLLRWKGDSVLYQAGSYVVSGGKPVLASATRNEMNYPYNFEDGSLANFNGDFWHYYMVTTAPSFKSGETILIREPVDFVGKGRQAWQYLLGQRRVRRAPSIGYDTPNSVTSGADFFDEVSLFLGGLDRYDWKLVGKKEMYIPYNMNNFHLQKVDDVLGQNHLNPQFVRWEKHRVWVVEANLAAGQRHTVPKKVFYVDEDTWNASLYDGWDAQGRLWRTGSALPILAYDFPGQLLNPFMITDFVKGSYEATIINEQSVQYGRVPKWPEDNYTPEAVAARGVR